MSIEDRDWYKEDFDRRMGRGKAKKESSAEGRSESAKQQKTGSFERVKKREPNHSEKRAYNNAPPAHTILAAKYELAIRRRTQKTFWAGFAIGAIVASGATALILPLV